MKWATHPRRLALIALVAIGGPGVVTLSAALGLEISTTAAAMLYVLVVVLSSAMGGSSAGVVASLLSFLALNFYFTRPLHTFLVGKAEDLIALVVFLFVSVVIGLFLSAALTQRREPKDVRSRPAC